MMMAMGTAGTATCCQRLSSFPFRARTVAIHSASASLDASDGWKVIPPRSIQFLLPLTSAPTSWTRPRRTTAAIMAGHARRLSHTTLIRESTNMVKMPIAANMPCLRASPYGDLPAAIDSTLEAERTIMMPMAVSARVDPRMR
jgi:hypothetical protein